MSNVDEQLRIIDDPMSYLSDFSLVEGNQMSPLREYAGYLLSSLVLTVFVLLLVNYDGVLSALRNLFV